jgi:hypothetical protein
VFFQSYPDRSICSGLRPTPLPHCFLRLDSFEG